MKKNYIKKTRPMTISERIILGVQVGCYIVSAAMIVVAGVCAFSSELSGVIISVTGSAIYLMDGYRIGKSRKNKQKKLLNR